MKRHAHTSFSADLATHAQAYKWLPVSRRQPEKHRKTWNRKKKACYHSDIYCLLLFPALCFHSISCFFCTILVILSVSFFAPQAWWGLHKISCLTGGTYPGATQRTLFQKKKKKKSRHPQPQLSPTMSPSHNTESDMESRGLLFKIAAHRHSSEDLNNQLWKGKKERKKKAEWKINWDPILFNVLVLSWISPTRN